MYVCVCKGVTSREVLEAVREGARCLDELSDRLGVSTGCGGCAPLVQCLIETDEGPGLARHASAHDAPAMGAAAAG